MVGRVGYFWLVLICAGANSDWSGGSEEGIQFGERASGGVHDDGGEGGEGLRD